MPPEVFFFFKERFLESDEFFFRTDCPAGGNKGLGHRETAFDILTGILFTLAAVPDPLFRDAGNHLVAAPILLFAAGAGDFLIGDHPIPVADLIPKPGGMAKLLRCLFEGWRMITGAAGTVVAAGCQDFLLTVSVHSNSKPLYFLCLSAVYSAQGAFT